MFEHFFQCPYCWEEISMLLDSSLVGTEYVEDCEICCNPISFSFKISANSITQSDVVSIEQ